MHAHEMKLVNAKDFMKEGRVYKPKLFATTKPCSSNPIPTIVNVLLIIITTVLQHNNYLQK